MGDHAEDALDLELEMWMDELEFGEDCFLDWPETDIFGLPSVKRKPNG